MSLAAKRIAILGSTGSIGQSALSVAEAHPDRLHVVGLAAGDNVECFAAQLERFRPDVASLATSAGIDRLRQTGVPLPGQLVHGAEGLVAVATHPDVDIVICASSGSVGLEAVLAAVEVGKTAALANKEVLVMAGELVMRTAAAHGGVILPVDSEHNAIHQCLDGRKRADVRRLLLTASGGPFLRLTTEQMATATPAAALQHPTWEMGRKITIDSATLMNKGLEVIEARWLFGLDADRIDVVVHPQSVVHSLVEFVDGSILAQLGVTDMRLPIQYACSYPDRWAAPGLPLDLTKVGQLEFEAPDFGRFPCLGLAYQALRKGGSVPCVLNAANEVAVEAFLQGKLSFTAIADVIGATIAAHSPAPVDSLPAVRAVDAWARVHAATLIPLVRMEA